MIYSLYMPIKIFGELENRILEMVKSGYNANRIAVEVGLSEGTISGWAKRKDIVLQKRISPETLAKEDRFVELLISGKIFKHICVELNLHHRAAIKMAKKHNLSHLLRNRKGSAKDKQLSIEQANARLPEGHGTVVRFDPTLKKYVIKRKDGTTYTRITSQIFRGDPNLSSRRRCSEEEISRKMLEIGYRLVPGTYVKKHHPIRAEHIVCGYIRENSIYNFIKQSCPKCSNTGTSKEEASLNEWINTFGIENHKYRFKKDCKGKGKGKEIDIFFPSLKLGIEYCGLFHHGVSGRKRIENGKNKRYEERGRIYEPTDYDNPKLVHKIKMDKCEVAGIRLITVFGNEWKENKQKVKNILRAKLGKNERRLYARDTEIRQISPSEANAFLDLYHLQGKTRFVVCFGLFLNNELIAVVSGNIHHRNNKEFVLNRLCFKENVTVVGGASKLNSALEKWTKEYGFSEIKTWSDNRWSNGDVYRSMGYQLVKEISPDYFYFDNQGKTYSKQSCQKKYLLKKGAVGNTEWEMAQSLKLDRIWDCGKKTWVKKLV